MLGVACHTIEVNPFLADLIRAKTEQYDTAFLKSAIDEFSAALHSTVDPEAVFGGCPETFIEPGKNNRWIFNREAAGVLASARTAIDQQRDPKIKRLFLTAMGSMLPFASNVVINGKGRRYRPNWERRSISADRLRSEFSTRLMKYLSDIESFKDRHAAHIEVLNDDARAAIGSIPEFDLAVFSPPYPNSFDYTDVYNLELWMLGYLSSRRENHVLRSRTLASHVQVIRSFAPPPEGSPTLETTIRALRGVEERLWHSKLIDMIGAYFAELRDLLSQMRQRLRSNGKIWIIVGNSRYAGVEIRSSVILGELAAAVGYKIERHINTRDMRSSPQQGGQKNLSENLLILS
ncbi:hypothetical protein [Neorhizobium sp. AL 9.2.2]|uniref:hypothetical protein n=1 Tax=Neorhizobium sp. AL 9.2.2 TaxID=2712894 RepID=UPI0015742044|nr:hypothetical protein [Neorhizobium sp. AL 9.2.2]NSY17716.1 hypothetical protein [Neorhizobium sp. AL 9.2.2]